jgi:hypothetical protein
MPSVPILIGKLNRDGLESDLLLAFGISLVLFGLGSGGCPIVSAAPPTAPSNSDQVRTGWEKRAYCLQGSTVMSAAPIDWLSEREELQARRNPLFERFEINPHNVRLAMEIKKIDDQIAECTERLTQEQLTRPTK